MAHSRNLPDTFDGVSTRRKTFKSVLVIGGYSDIAISTLRHLLAGSDARVVLAGRSESKLANAAEQLSSRAPLLDVTTTQFDALNIENHERFLRETLSNTTFDLVLISFGVLGNQQTDVTLPANAATVITTNFTATAALLLELTKQLADKPHCTIALVSSVAAIRARAANFIYGSSKAGVDQFFQGLTDALRHSHLKLVLIRPGFVHTKMTASRKPQPGAISCDRAGKVIALGLRQGYSEIWAPPYLKYVFGIIRVLPRRAFRLIKT